ncbi:hypothetical protein Tco_0949845 [Tanacetum coccineum]
MKQPMRISPEIGTSQPVNLKQALRGLSISQASEIAAMKRLSKDLKQHGVSVGLEVGPVKRSQVAAGDESSDDISRTSVTELGQMVKLDLLSYRCRTCSQIPPPEKTKEEILLLYVRRLFVKCTGKPTEILSKLNELAGFE